MLCRANTSQAAKKKACKRYSMIIWNCKKENHSNSALEPLLRLPNVPKVAYVWDILIFQAFGTIRFTGASCGAYLQLKNIEGF